MRQWDANNIGVDFGLGQPDAPLAAVTFRWAGKLAVRCLEASVLSRDGDEHLQRCERLSGRSWGFFHVSLSAQPPSGWPLWLVSVSCRLYATKFSFLIMFTLQV